MRRSRKCTLFPEKHTRLIMVGSQSGCDGFFDDACYAYYLRRLHYSLSYFQVQLHAYALLPHNIWLLLTPKTLPGAQGLIQALNKAYTQYYNTRFVRTGQSWSKSYSVYAPQEYGAVLACQKLVEREPVQHNLVQHVGVWRWTSYSANAFGAKPGFLTQHPAISKFLRSDPEPGKRYRAFIAANFDSGCYEFLRNSIKYQSRLAAENRPNRREQQYKAPSAVLGQAIA